MPISTTAPQRARKESGQAAIMATFAIIFLIGMLGLVVDVGYGYYVKQCAQAAADAGALAAAVYLSNNTVAIDGQSTVNCASSPTAGTYSGVACLYAQANGFTNSGNQSVSVTSGTGTAPSGVSTGYWLTVKVSQNVPSLFSAVLGESGLAPAASSTAGTIKGSGCSHSGLTSMQSTFNAAVLGLANSTIINSNVVITGNESVYTGGSITNMAPSTVTGNVYESTTGQCANNCGPGKVGGSVIVDPTDLQSMVNTANSNASKAASFTATQTFNGISSPTTINGNGGTNVIQVNGNITNSVTLSGTSDDVFIVNVTGTVTLNGTTSLSVSGGVTADHVLWNFTGSSGTISAQVGNVLYGTLLAPKYNFSIDGKWYGEIVSGGSVSLLSNASFTGNGFSCGGSVYYPALIQ